MYTTTDLHNYEVVSGPHCLLEAQVIQLTKPFMFCFPRRDMSFLSALKSASDRVSAQHTSSPPGCWLKQNPAQLGELTQRSLSSLEIFKTRLDAALCSLL